MGLFNYEYLFSKTSTHHGVLVTILISMLYWRTWGERVMGYDRFDTPITRHQFIAQKELGI